MSPEKEIVQKMLQRIWDNYATRFEGQEHDLVVIAIPRYPSQVEALAEVDVTKIRAVLRQFVNVNAATGPTGPVPDEVVRVNISLPEDLLEQIDAHIKTTGQTRSGFLMSAALKQMEGK